MDTDIDINIEICATVLCQLCLNDSFKKEQTHKTIRGHLVEECAEILEAIDLDSPEKMREELGDLLMHIALHAEIAAEENHFTFDDIVNELNEKIVRRHPHVFADKKAFTSDDVLKIWQQVKTQEKKERVVGKLFDGIPPEISALRYALDVAKKAPVEIVSETNANLNSTPEIEIGKELFDIVKKATQAKVEPEAALREYILQIRKTAEKNNL